MTTSQRLLSCFGAAFLALSLVAACGGNVPLGDEVDSDQNPGADAAMCGCDQSSCATGGGIRTCGRSDCGFPCGECASNQWCALGTCADGVGPGETCVDVFGNPVWEGDTGFTECPGSSDLRACTCSGGGPNSWIGCADTCLTRCTTKEQLCIDFCDAGSVICSPPWANDPGACETPCLADLADCSDAQLAELDACVTACNTLADCVAAVACVGN